jgi:hypothetical protein
VVDDIVFIDAEFFGLFRYLLADRRRAHKSGTDHNGADITCRSFFGDHAARPQHPGTEDYNPSSGEEEPEMTLPPVTEIKPRTPAPPMVSLPIGKPRIVMNGGHLDIQASVDLEGLKQLQTMLQKYAEILEMMAPKKDEAPN